MNVTAHQNAQHAGFEPELEREDFKGRLRLIIPYRGENAFARRAGISPSGLRGALKNGNTGREMLIAIAREGRVSLEWLATGQGPRTADADRNALGDGEVAAYTAASPAARSGSVDRHPAGQTRATPAPGGGAGPAPGRSLSISMNAPPAPAALDRGEFANLPLLARCLDAAHQIPAALSTEQQLALALRLGDALAYIAAGQPVPQAIDMDVLIALARLLYQLHPPAAASVTGPGP